MYRRETEAADSITCEGTLFRASTFLSEELPIRLAHRVQELGTLPDHLNEMPSIKKVQDWYAQSFEVRSAAIIKDGKRNLTVRKGTYNPSPTQPFIRDTRASHSISQTKRSRLLQHLKPHHPEPERKTRAIHLPPDQRQRQRLHLFSTLLCLHRRRQRLASRAQ